MYIPTENVTLYRTFRAWTETILRYKENSEERMWATENVMKVYRKILRKVQKAQKRCSYRKMKIYRKILRKIQKAQERQLQKM